MATDVGIRLVADGEKQFKSALSAVNSQIKNLNSEMKLTVNGLTGMENSEEGASSRADLLSRSLNAAKKKVEILTDEYDRQKAKLDDLSKALDKVSSEFGSNSREARKAASEYNRQAKAVNDLGTQLNNAVGDAKKFEKQIKDTGDAAHDATGDIKDAADSAKGFKDVFLGNIGADLAENVVSGLKSIATAMSDIVTETKEYRKIMGTLEVSSTNAGYTAEQTSESYMKLYGVLGDTQSTATTLANLQALGLEQDKLNTVIDGSIGAWATYGDSIPIDGLAESINETIKAGKVTGTFADVLNWAGTNEDDFNEKLAAASTETERADLLLEELANQGLPAAATAWRDANESIVAANESQAKMDEAMARIAEVFAPAVQTLNEFLADMALKFAEILENGSPLLPVLVGIATALAGLTVITIVVANLAKLKSAFGAVQAAIVATNGVLAANPLLIIITLIAAVTAALITAYTTNEEFREKVQAAFKKVKETVGDAVGAIEKFFTVTIPESVKKGIEFLNKIPENAVNIGKDIIKGLWNGINNMGAWIGNKIKGFCGDVLGSIKDFFGIKSPSRVMRDEVGLMIGKGMAEGIEKSEAEVLNAAQELNNKLIAKENELTEKLKENNLDEAVKNNLTEQLNTVKQFRSEYEKALSEIETAQKNMAEKLAGYGELFTTAETEVGKVINLNDLQEQIDAINRYGDALENLKNRGVSDSLLDEIQNLDIASATGYMDKLLEMTDSDYDEYMRLWEEKQEASQEVASNFYKSKLDDLKNGMTEQMNGYFGEFEAVGTNLMDGVSEGIEAGRSGVINAVRDALYAAVNEANAVMEIHSPSKVFGRIGKFMAQGLGVGFGNEMKTVSNDISGRMINAAQRVTDESLQNVASAAVNGMQLNSLSSNSQPIIIQLVTDGQKLAEVIFDPLKDVSKQRGVALG